MIRMTETLGRLDGWRRALLALASGALAALSLPPLGLWPALFVAFPVFLALIAGTAPRRWHAGFGTGWLFGLGYFAVAFHWIGFAFLVDADTYLWMMPFMVGGLAGGMAIYWGLAGLVLVRLRLSGLALVFGTAALLGLVEWLRGHLFTGFPWAAPGLAVDGMGGLAQMAAFVGMPGLTVLVVLWAGLPYGAFDPQRGVRRVAAILLLVSLPLAWGAGSLRLAGAIDSAVPGVALRIVQPNISQEAKWRQENAREIFDDLKTLSAAASAEHPDGIGSITHVIWPESAVPFAIDESPAAKAELAPLLGGRTVLITGSLRRETLSETDVRVFNSIIVFDGAAEPVARYDKWRLVPGGEFLPFEWLLEPLGFRKVVTVPGSFASGPGPVTLSVPGAPDAGFLVCYEAIFPHDLVDPARRPAFLVNVTNDGWFGQSTGPYQHLAQARLRAIEQGLPLVRAANTGISAVIDAYGRELRTLPLMERGVLDSALPTALPPTLYAHAGDWAGGAIMLVFMMLALVLRSGPVVSSVSRN